MKTIKPVSCLRSAAWCLLGLFLFLVSSAHAQVVGIPLHITCPTNLDLWTCSSNLTWQYQSPVVTGGCSNKQVICVPPSGFAFPLGVTTVNCRVTDSCGNADSCQFTVTVRRDTEAPKIDCPPDMTVLACPTAAGGCGAIVTYPAPTATDNSGSVAVTCNPPSGTPMACGDHVVVCTAVDRCENRAICRFTVSVKEGGVAPGIQCPTDRTITTCSNSAVLVYPAPVVNPAGTPVVCTPPSGTVVGLGVHVVTCVASNACGRSECKFNVTVRPIPQVSILCPTNTLVFTVPCGSNCVPVNYPLPTVFNGALESCNPPQGTCMTEGVHIVVCRATNQCGGVLCEFPVRVIKGQGNPPQIQCPNDLTATTCSNTASVVYPPPTVSPAGTSVVCTPPSGSPFALGSTIVSCVASNACGRSECKFTVTVRHLNPPVITCPVTNLTYTIPCGSNCVPVVYPLPTVANGALQSCTPPQGTCLPEGTHVVICRATNECGSVTCEFPVRVIRGQGNPPTIRCPEDVTLVTCSNCVPITYPRPTVIDGTLVKCDPPTGTCLPVGDYTVTCVATNPCGTARCEFKLHVIPGAEKPTMSVSVQQGYLVVCWTKTCRCFKLQGARDLTPPMHWIDITTEPTDHGDSYCVRVPFTQGFHFFRLVQCDQRTAMVYDVTGLPISDGTASKLVDSLKIPREKVFVGDGSVRFLDPVKFQAVPHKPITDPALIAELRQDTEGDKGELAFEGIDFDSLKRLQVMDGKEAISRFSEALKAATLLPASAEPVPRHTTFEATDEKGEPSVPEMPIDTGVSFQFDLGGIPLIGPGAKLSIAFGPGGEPTSLLGSFREHKPFREIPILPIEEATKRCQNLYPGLGSKVSPRLVYYAPSLLLPAVQKLIPCYECGGDGIADGTSVNLLRSLIPATDDPAYAPVVSLDADAKGTLVNAKATVDGGKPPYTYQWTSSSVDLGHLPADASSIEYVAVPRDEARVETVRVIVTDANGVVAQASRTVVLGPSVAGGLAEVLFAPAVAGVSDFGIERGVSDLCAGQQAAFNARFMGAGYTRQFNFSGASAWERDFKEGGTGLDHLYVDNADLTFYMGHGYGGGFTFENNHDDGTLYYTDAVKAWGDKDLEWLCLLSCSVMADTYDGKSCFARWTPTFDGLHLMMGFANTAYDEDGFAATFADWSLGRFWILPPMPLRSSWLLATDSNQPGSVIASVMGVIGPSGMSNYNDYFHGKGPVGPDLRGSNIRGFWRIKH